MPVGAQGLGQSADVCSGLESRRGKQPGRATAAQLQALQSLRLPSPACSRGPGQVGSGPSTHPLGHGRGPVLTAAGPEDVGVGDPPPGLLMEEHI